MKVEEKIKAMGLELPDVPKPLAAYVPGVKADNVIYTSGQIPLVKGELKYKGKVGKDLTEQEGYEAAKVCVLNCLSIIKDLTGDLDKVEQVIKVNGFVASAPDFNMQPKVINGASELLKEVFGDKGIHARAAVGVNELPINAACEVELIVKVRD
ncbi:MAG: RidA family protein [Clostridia bacterium]|nr:RidA family protein [Clostridia bacterium]